MSEGLEIRARRWLDRLTVDQCPPDLCSQTKGRRKMKLERIPRTGDNHEQDLGIVPLVVKIKGLLAKTEFSYCHFRPVGRKLGTEDDFFFSRVAPQSQ